MRLHLSHILFLILLAIGIAWPQESADALLALTTNFSAQFGWFVLLICTAFVGIALYLILSKYGKLRLGHANDSPEFSYGSWIAMLFAAGMGTGLVFYGAAEPLLHVITPPPGNEDPTNLAHSARYAMAVTYFHWGIHAWAIYAMAGLAVAYIAFRRDSAMLPSASCIRTETKPHHRALGHGINSLAILAIIFGLVGSISQGVLLVTEGLERQLGTPDSSALRVGVIVLMTVCYMLSASTGIKRGIKLLSNINILIALALMLFVFFAGPTLALLHSFADGVGQYAQEFFALSFNRYAFAESHEWVSGWSVQYLLWWVAWAPFVGVFIARISRGRTVREFLLGVILVPTIISSLWFAIFGGTALSVYETTPDIFSNSLANADGIIFSMLATMPFAELTAWVTLFLVFIFLVTSADSGMFILGMFSDGGKLHPSIWQKTFWGVIIALLAIFTATTGRSTEFFRAVAIAGALPYILIMLVQLVTVAKCMHHDAKQDTNP